MEIEESSLYREIELITSGGQKPVHYQWFAQFHVDNKTFDFFKVLSVDIVCDYEEKYADEILLTAMLPLGTYAKQLYPFRHALEITIFKVPIGEMSDGADAQQAVQTERYTATLIDKGNPILEGNTPMEMSEETLNLTNISELQFQLVNKALEQLRMISVGGVYRNTPACDVLKAVLTEYSTKLQVDGVRMPQGVDMVPASNQAKRTHVVIPQGTKLVQLAQYLHTKCGGIYSTGMGYYLQGDYWYVYPCYDTKRMPQAQRTMTIINVPKNKFPGVERTYRQSGNNTVVMATGEVRFKDDSEIQQLNLGNGVRFSDANKFMDGFVKNQNNKSMSARGQNNSEFVFEQRAQGNNLVQRSANAITANPFDEYSKLARRNGGFLSLVWENSNPSLVFPGMMIKVLYLEGNEIRQIEGVVLKAHHYVHLKGQTFTATRHTTNTMLAIFVQRQPKEVQ